MAEKYVEVVNADGTISYKQAEGAKSIGGWNFIGYEPEFVAWAEARGEGVRAETSFLKALSKTRELAGRSHIGHQDRLLERQRLPSLQSDDSSTYDLRSQQQCAYHPLCEVLLMNSEAKVRLGKMETQATTKCAGVQA